MDNFFAKNLAHIRQSGNMTQEQLAGKLFVTRQAVSKWERGETEPDIVTLCAISSLFDITVDDLLKKDCTQGNVAACSPSPAIADCDTELKRIQAKKLAKKMALFAVFDIAAFALITGIIFTACINYSPHIWIIWFALPLLVCLAFMIKSRHEIGARRILFLFPVPFLSGMLYLLIQYLSPSAYGAWLVFLFIPLYYAAALLAYFLTGKKGAK